MKRIVLSLCILALGFVGYRWIGSVNTDAVQKARKNLELARTNKGCRATNCDFTDGNFQKENFDGLTLDGAIFNTSLSECSFKGTSLRGAIFDNTNLSYADFSTEQGKKPTDLSNAKFVGHLKPDQFDQTKFDNAILDGTIFSNVIFRKNISFKGAKIKNDSFKLKKLEPYFSNVQFEVAPDKYETVTSVNFDQFKEWLIAKGAEIVQEK
jgi:uncharacterized protein YjbI with pentapeptide repeats